MPPITMTNRKLKCKKSSVKDIILADGPVTSRYGKQLISNFSQSKVGRLANVRMGNPYETK